MKPLFDEFLEFHFPFCSEFIEVIFEIFFDPEEAIPLFNAINIVLSPKNF